MEPFKKVYDNFIENPSMTLEKNARVIRMESPDADVKLTITFYKSDPPEIDVCPVRRKDGPWNFVQPPTYAIKTDVDRMPTFAEASVPNFSMGTDEAPTMIKYMTRVQENLALLDVIIAVLRAGETWEGDPKC